MITLSQIARLNTEPAVARILHRRFGDDVEQLLDALDAGLNALLRTNLGKAAEYVNRAGKCYAFLPKRCRPRLLSMQARQSHWTGDYTAALKTYKYALRLFLHNREFEAAARLRKGLIDVYMYVGRYAEALSAGKKSLAFFRRKNLVVDAAQVMTNIGNVYHRMDNNRTALGYYDKARKVFEEDGGIPLAIVDYNRANIYTNLNNLKQAESLYLAAAGIYQQSGMEIAHNQTKYSLAYLYFLQDRFAEALQTFEIVFDGFSRLGDTKSAAVTHLDLVEIHIQLNQNGSAIMLGENVIPRFRKLGMRYEEAKVRYFIALARLNLGDCSHARGALATAERLFAREKNSLWLGMVHLARGRLHLSRRQYGKALEACVKASRFYRRCGDNRRMIDTRLVLIEATLKSGNTGKARRMAAILARQELVSYQSFTLYDLIGQSFQQEGNPSDALDSYKRAINALETMIDGLYPDEIRSFFVADKLETYQRMVDCLLELDRVDDSFLCNLKALATINQRNIHTHRSKQEISPRLQKKREELRASLRKMNQSLESGSRGSESHSAYLTVEQKLLAHERKIRAYTHPLPVAGLDRRNQVDEFSLSRLVHHNETVVSFNTTGKQVGVFCASKESATYIPLDISFEQLQVIVRKLQFLCENSVLRTRHDGHDWNVINHYLNQLHKSLITPLLPHLQKKRLIIVADALFAQVPFTALCDSKGSYLKDVFDLNIVVNPRDLLNRRRRCRPLAFSSNAAFAVSSPTLPAIEQEVRHVSACFSKSRVYINESATAQMLLSELQESKGFVHIAAHASRSSENPLFSRILLGDGPFFPFNLFGTGIRSTLVTLSGCQTAAPGLYCGNSFSLAKVFYQAGARFVLASLWPVSDQLSMIFMSDFYKVLKEVGDVPTAYLHATNRMAELTSNPAIWGAYVLLGI